MIDCVIVGKDGYFDKCQVKPEDWDRIEQYVVGETTNGYKKIEFPRHERWSYSMTNDVLTSWGYAKKEFIEAIKRKAEEKERRQKAFQKIQDDQVKGKLLSIDLAELDDQGVSEEIGTTGPIVDLFEEELTQEEWNALCVVHRMRLRLKLGIRFDWSKSIDVRASKEISQIVDEEVFLSKEK